MNKETELQNAIRFAVNKSGKARVFRNLVGNFFTKVGTRVKAGLSVGSADLIGWHIPSGKFLSLEIKLPNGRVDPEQQAWCDTVNKYGGCAAIVRSVEEALNYIHGIK